MLVENSIEIIIIQSTMEFIDLRLQLYIGVVDPFGIVVFLPEFDRPRVGGDECGTAEQRHQRRIQQGRD